MYGKGRTSCRLRFIKVEEYDQEDEEVGDMSVSLLLTALVGLKLDTYYCTAQLVAGMSSRVLGC